MQNEKIPAGWRILAGFVSFILCMALFVGMIAAMVLADVRVLTQEDNMKALISEIMFSKQDKVRMPGVLPQAVGPVVKLEEAGLNEAQQAMVDWMYDLLKEQFGEEVAFTKNEVEDLMMQSTLPEFLSEKMAGVMTDIYTEDYSTTITTEEILEQIDLNQELIEEKLGVEITGETKNKVVTWSQENDVVGMVHKVVKGETDLDLGGITAVGDGASLSGGVINGLLSGKATIQDVIKGGIPTILAAVREITSTTMILTILGACIVIIGLLFLVNFKRPYLAVRYVGTTAFVAGLPFAAATVAVFAAPSLFTGMILSIVAMVLTLTAGISIGVPVAGLVLIIVSYIISTICRRKHKAESAPVVQACVDMPVLVETPVEPAPVVAEEIPEAPAEIVIAQTAAEIPVEEPAETVAEEVAEEAVAEEAVEEGTEEIPTPEQV